MSPVPPVSNPKPNPELLALLALLQCPGMGKKRLAQFLGGRKPSHALAGGLPGGRLPRAFPEALAGALKGLKPEAGRGLFEHCQKNNIHLVSDFGGHPMPGTLEALPDPPACLFARGNLELLNQPGLAVVGSRGATAYGRAGARLAAREASHLGLVVWSGLARGVDGEAHRACLRAKGKTVAVLGCGVDVIYPQEHRSLTAEILAQQGLLLSEFLPGTRPLPGHFPLRNRLIAGLTEATLVVEGGGRSGSLITARLAMEMGREVMALPHPITSRLGVGPNTLIRLGAALIQTGQDIRDALPLHLRDRLPALNKEPIYKGQGENPATEPDLTQMGPSVQKLWPLLLPGTSLIADELVVITGLGSPEVMSALLELELAGLVRQVGGRYERNL